MSTSNLEHWETAMEKQAELQCELTRLCLVLFLTCSVISPPTSTGHSQQKGESAQSGRGVVSYCQVFAGKLRNVPSVGMLDDRTGLPGVPLSVIRKGELRSES